MSIWNYLPSLISSLFRLSVYIFLRVIPTSLAKRVLPTLYIAYLSSLALLAPRRQSVKSTSKSKIFWTLVLSLPTTSRRLWSSNVLINTLLFAAAADLIVAPYLDPAHDVMFARVGAVYPDSVKITARYKQDNSTSLRILYREIIAPNTTSWKDGPLLSFKEENDWVGTVRVGGLWPNTSYEYILTTVNRTVIHYPRSPLGFRTFPDPRLLSETHLKFLVSSCVTPNFPYRGPMYHRSIRGFDLLADYVFSNKIEPGQEVNSPAISHPRLDRIEFLLFLGDFIYADVPVYIGDDKEAYRRLYRRNYNSDSFRKIYERLPIFHAYDDHEFINNFGASGDDHTPPYINASSAFKIYNSNANFDPIFPGEHYYDFRYGDAAFFVMDTRRYRTEMGTPNRTMLGDIQMLSLNRWLSRMNATATFKFVVTSVPFTSLWGHDAQSDSWAGFPEEKQALLAAFHSVPNVIILSGDRHEFAAIEFTGPQPHDYSVWEFSTSPLNMFYIPFFRTLRMQSDTFVRKNRSSLVSTEAGSRIEHHVEDIPSERVIKYIPTGNVKWSTIEIDTNSSEKPRLRLEVLIDGKPKFNFELMGFPVIAQQSKALGTMITGSMKDIINRLGIKPSGWF